MFPLSYIPSVVYSDNVPFIIHSFCCLYWQCSLYHTILLLSILTMFPLSYHPSVVYTDNPIHWEVTQFSVHHELLHLSGYTQQYTQFLSETFSLGFFFSKIKNATPTVLNCTKNKSKLTQQAHQINKQVNCLIHTVLSATQQAHQINKQVNCLIHTVLSATQQAHQIDKQVNCLIHTVLSAMWWKCHTEGQYVHVLQPHALFLQN